MPSQSFRNFNQRMRDIEQLLQAHTALTQFQQARRAAQRAGGELERIAEIIGNLVNRPGRGRRTEVAALNRSAIVLLSAHLQGFIEDLHSEAANIVLAHRAANVSKVIKNSKPRTFNPHSDVIEKIFDGIGLYDILKDIHWQNATNPTIKRRLTEYIQLRNRIAHGAQESVTKARVTGFKDFVEHFAENLDETVAAKVQEYTGTRPW